jgi:hypothetical protein
MRSGHLSKTATSAGRAVCLLTAPSWQLTGGFSCLPRYRAGDRLWSRRAERAWQHEPAGWRWK